MASKSIKKETVRWKNSVDVEQSAERWVARYREHSGAPQRKRNFRRRLDAQQWLDEITADLKTGRYVDPNAGKVTFHKFYVRWSDQQVWVSKTRDGADRAAASVTFGTLPMREIRRAHVQSWVKTMTTTLAPTTIDTRFTIIRGAFRAAVKDKIISEDPCVDVKLPRVPKQADAIEIPTPEEVGLLLEHAEPKRRSTRVGFSAYVALLSWAGVRMAEGIGVQVGDVDFLRREIKVARQLQRASADDIKAGRNIVTASGGTMVLVCPPKYNSVRTIALPDELLEILSAYIAEHCPGDDPQRWLFHIDGEPLHDNIITWRWRATRKAAGVQTKLHNLRHFYASGLIAAGCDVTTVSKNLGHGSTQTTHNTYLHQWKHLEDKTRAAASLLAQQTIAGLKLGSKASTQSE